MLFRNKKAKEPYSAKKEFLPYLEQITDSNLKNYIIERVMGQIEWYDRESSKDQACYKGFMIASIILSALIPIFTLLSDVPYRIYIKIIITSISSAVTVISAIIALYNFRELWIQYRSNCEILKSVLHRFFTKSGEFNNIDESKSYEMLVMSCEEYLTKEFQTWVASNTPKSNSNHDSSTSS